MADGGLYRHAIQRDVAAILGVEDDYFARQVPRRPLRSRTLLDGLAPASVLFVAVAITTWSPALTSGPRRAFDTIGGAPPPKEVAYVPAVASTGGRSPWALGRERSPFRMRPPVSATATPVAEMTPAPAPIEAVAALVRSPPPSLAMVGERAPVERPARHEPAADPPPEPPARIDTPQAAKAAERERVESIDALRDLRLK